MSKLVVDADGQIKFGKSGVLAALIGDHEVLVPAAVFGEAVVKGKQELYEDAFELERILEDEKARIVRARPEPRADRLLENVASLGPGERGALRLHLAEEADVVLSDDRVFLNFLGRHAVPCVAPVNVVVALTRSGSLSFEEGSRAMDELGGYVRAEVHEKARVELEELQKESGQDLG